MTTITAASSRRAIAAGIICALLLPGCAYTYLDADGTTHIVGLVAIQIPKENSGFAEAARVVQVTNIGISAVRSDISSSLSLGYNSERVVVIGENVCVGLKD